MGCSAKSSARTRVVALIDFVKSFGGQFVYFEHLILHEVNAVQNVVL